MLKEEADRIKSFYVTDTSGRFETLEDLKLFPNLEELHLTYDTGSMTDEEKEEFQEAQSRNYKYAGGNASGAEKAEKIKSDIF